MQMTKLEKSLCLEFESSSTIPAIEREDDFLYLKKYLYQKKDIFRVGLKMSDQESRNPAFIFVLTSANNLQKMGQRVKAVISSARVNNGIAFPVAWRETEMKEIGITTSGNADEGNGGAQYFIHQLKRDEIKCTDFTFDVSVHFTGIVDNYQVQQIDGLLSDQLWLSVTEQLDGEGFKLIASDESYLPVHKWMLAARSPVFAALFSSEEDIQSLHLIINCNAEEMSQFIRFIYTGELEGLVTQELAQLAIKYQIKTLEKICEAALKDAHFSVDKIALIALQMKSGSYFCQLEDL